MNFLKSSKLFILLIFFLFLTSSIDCLNPVSKFSQLTRNVSLNYMYLGSLITAIDLTNGNHKCYSDLVKIAQDYANNQSDLKYVQYSAYFDDDKTLFDFGYYRECLAQNNSNYCLITGTKVDNLIKYDERTWSDKNITIPYIANWMNHINISRKVDLLMGLCLPSSCSSIDATKIASQLVDHSQHFVSLDRCELSSTPIKLNKYQIMACLLVGSIILIHFIAHLLPSNLNLNVFNLRENFALLFNTNIADEAIPCLYGLKSLSMLIVLIGNLQYLAYIPSKYASIDNDQHSYSFIGRTNNVYVYLVDTFFLISGCLSIRAAYSKFRGIRNYKIIFARSYRFATLITWTIALNFLLFMPAVKKHFAGPLWETFLAAKGLNEACQDHWWSDIMLLDLWRFRFNQCTISSWILALDVVYFATVLYLVLPLLDLNVIVIIGMALSTLTGIIAAGITLRKVSYPPTIVSSQLFTPGYFDFVNFFLTKPWIHGTVYVMGTLIAVYAKRNKDQLSKERQFVYTALTVAFFGLLAYCENLWSKVEKINFFSSIVYGSTVRLVWALAFCWIIFAAHTQQRFSLLNRFLSNKIFIPLSRLNLSLLMTNFIVIRFRNATRIYPSNNSFHEQLLYEWLPNLFLMYMLATISTLIVEIPFSRYVKRFIGIREKTGAGRILTRPQIYSDFGIGRNTISREVHDKNMFNLKNSQATHDGTGFYSIKF